VAGSGGGHKGEAVTKSWAVIKMYQGLNAKGRGAGAGGAAGGASPGAAKGSEAQDASGPRTPRGAAASGGAGGLDVVDAQRGVKEELEGRSAYMKQVVADRAAFADMIADLTAQITGFKPQDVFQVEAFTEELERRLALLSDERMVLKAFCEWPEKKVEAMREAVARKCELERLAASLDPDGATWSAKESINDELQQVLERFQEGKAKVESYLRSKDDIRRSLAAHRCSTPTPPSRTRQ